LGFWIEGQGSWKRTFSKEIWIERRAVKFQGSRSIRLKEPTVDASSLTASEFGVLAPSSLPSMSSFKGKKYSGFQARVLGFKVR
jgi:hypothetical protein